MEENNTSTMYSFREEENWGRLKLNHPPETLICQMM